MLCSKLRRAPSFAGSLKAGTQHRRQLHRPGRGAKEFKDAHGTKGETAFYDGLIFHRVIRNS
jgi:hypothetical protein